MIIKVKKWAVSAIIAGITTATVLISTPASAATIPFTDVPTTDIHYQSVVELYNEGIIEGTTATTFEPYKPVTRQETALFIANALNLDTVNVQDSGFTDVPKTSKYYGAIAALSNAGIINGYQDGTFKPNDFLKRSQVAKMLTIGFELNKSENTTTQFTDVNAIDDIATRQYIQTLVNYNITTGKTATTFDPYGDLTRAQIATFLKRAMEQTEGLGFQVISVE